MKTTMTIRSLATLGLAMLGSASSFAAVAYTPTPVHGTPVVGPGVSPPTGVYGKEYSHDLDHMHGGAADPEQVLAWDGIGGTADAIDYSDFPRIDGPEEDQVDAIANHRDALFDETIRDESNLLFSYDDKFSAYGGFGGGGPAPFTIPAGGPVTLMNGTTLGGSGEVNVELAGMFHGAPAPQFLWAKQPEVNKMPLPQDVDGLEVWGPEPRENGDPDMPVPSDADKYSLDVDIDSGVSVWNADGTPYIAWPTIAAAVESKLGFVPPSAFSMNDDHQGRQAINLDALMVSDIIEDRNIFHEDIAVAGPDNNLDELLDQNGTPIEPFGPEGEQRGDAIIFSIRQIVDPADPDGYYATGSELFVLDSLGGVSFLAHGGHLWDHGYTLTEMAVHGEQFEHGVLDINAIEAIGEEVIAPPVLLPGDFNADGTVDAADYAMWRNNLGGSDPLSGNGDETGASAGTVDAADYALWRGNYGAMLPSPAPIAAAAAAPEPAAALLLLLGAAGALMRRKR